MLSSSLDTLLKLSKTTSPHKLFTYYCLTPRCMDGGPLETLADSTLLLAHNTIPMHVSTIVLLVIVQA